MVQDYYLFRERPDPASDVYLHDKIKLISKIFYKFFISDIQHEGCIKDMLE